MPGRKLKRYEQDDWLEQAPVRRKVKAAALVYLQDLFNGDADEPLKYAQDFGIPVRKLTKYLYDPNGLRALVEEAGDGHINSALSKLLSEISREVHDPEFELSTKEKIDLATFLAKLRGGSFDKSEDGSSGAGVHVHISLPVGLEGPPDQARVIEAEIVGDAEKTLKKLTDG